MKTIKTHWRLAYKATVAAIKVTFRVIIRNIKLLFSLNKFQFRLLKKRKAINQYIENNIFKD